MSRNLTTLTTRNLRKLERISDLTARELSEIYALGLNDVRVTLSRLYEQYDVSSDMTGAELARFARLSRAEEQVIQVMDPYIKRTRTILEEAMVVAVAMSFARGAWAVEQSVGVNLGWGAMRGEVAQAAAGLIYNPGALDGYMSAGEAKKHHTLLTRALKNYDKDAKRWIGREVARGIRQGRSVSQVAKSLQESGIAKTYRSAMTISRTETLRAVGVGTRMVYADAADHGIGIQESWETEGDELVRPEHVDMNGQVKVMGYFTRPGGQQIRGPRESGDAEFDINCRCDIRAEVDGMSPEVMRTREKGIAPFEGFESWAKTHGMSANRYGQKYSFLD